MTIAAPIAKSFPPAQQDLSSVADEYARIFPVCKATVEKNVR